MPARAGAAALGPSARTGTGPGRNHSDRYGRIMGSSVANLRNRGLGSGCKQQIKMVARPATDVGNTSPERPFRVEKRGRNPMHLHGGDSDVVAHIAATSPLPPRSVP